MHDSPLSWTMGPLPFFAARMDAWNAAFNAQEKKIKEERSWINKFRDKQPVAVKQREAKLEKLINSKDYVQKPPFVGKPFRFRFPDAPRLSPEVRDMRCSSRCFNQYFTILFSPETNDRLCIARSGCRDCRSFS